MLNNIQLNIFEIKELEQKILFIDALFSREGKHATLSGNENTIRSLLSLSKARKKNLYNERYFGHQVIINNSIQDGQILLLMSKEEGDEVEYKRFNKRIRN